MASLLLVDDDETIVANLLDLFSEEHSCDAAGTAEEALKKLEARDFDVVITDIAMPGMSGEDLLGFIKSYRPRTPVIFISGSMDRQRAEGLLVKGAFNYLMKPFRLEEIEDKVARAVEFRGRR